MPISDLTPAELAALEAAAAGETGPAYAKRIGLSPWTVKDHRKRVRQKLGASTMGQAIAIAAVEREQRLRSGEGEPGVRQISCFHARADALDDQLKRKRGESKLLALEATCEEFGIEAESVGALTYRQLSWAIDFVTMELGGVRA